MGTCNVTGISVEGAARHLIEEISKYKREIVTQQETHLTVNGVQELDMY